MGARLRIGSRGSKLALWQAYWVRDQLLNRYPELTVEIQIIKTTGDKILDVSLAKIGGRGVFTKEIEEAMLAGEIDLAVHSLKDLPTELPDELQITVITEREDVRDALIANQGIRSLQELPEGAIVGTSSLRRQAQLRARRPDLTLRDLRGNVDTRLKKLQAGEYDAIILATAGLVRLGHAEVISARLSFDEMLPAIGQGALAIETRQTDEETNDRLQFLNHPATRAATEAERALLKALGGGCQVPIAGHALVQSEQLTLHGLVASLDGQRIVRQQLTGAASQAGAIGAQLAEALRQAGAAEILAQVYAAPPTVEDVTLT